MALPPPPPTDYVIHCPACTHRINSHSERTDPRVEQIQVVGCEVGGADNSCPCRWTPNDIAHHLLFSELTRPSSTPLSDRMRRSLPW